MEIRIIGNDIELDREKVARIFDIRPTLRDRLEEAIENANNYESRVQEAFEDGKNSSTTSSLEENHEGS
mgnify:CR=1 FL=1|tara:strand:+ start:234 stop:440 length:207 start_codon:yes stop_codon:yes gene_type:complete